MMAVDAFDQPLRQSGSPWAHFRGALSERFSLRRRWPVIMTSAVLFVGARLLLGPSAPLALALGLWCAYCCAYLGVSIINRVSAPTMSIRMLLALAIVAATVGALVGTAVEDALWPLRSSDWSSQALRWVWHAVFVATMITIPAAQGLSMARRMAKADAERAQVEARLIALQAQIEPHFLFNTLATLRSLIRRDAAQAAELLDRLTDFFRSVLPETRQTRSTLQRETDILRAYLSIMQSRLGERLSYSIDAEPACLAAQLPPLLLQPLVENAIKHGIEPSEAGGAVQLSARLEDAAWLVVEVRNTGEALEGAAKNEQSAGKMAGKTGLANIRERLSALYADDGSLTLSSDNQNATIAVLRIPFAVET